MPIKIGTIFNYFQLPDVSSFPFVINKRNDGIFVKKGLFVYTKTIEGFLIGMVEKIVLSNEYFSDALTIKAYSGESNPNILKGLFPSEDFEFAVAIVKSLGLITFKGEKTKDIEKVHRMTYPASPGADVFLVEEDILREFLGLNLDAGLNLGKIQITNYEAKINLNRLLNKHFAILAISGAGKSYLTSVLIEELLTRDASYGTPAIILIDVHGEYTYFKDIQKLKDKVKMIDVSYFQIAVPKLHAQSFRKYQDKISHVQVRELSKYIKKLQEDNTTKGNYNIHDLITLIESDSEGGKSTKQALIGWLSELETLRIFGSQENPLLKNVVKTHELTIFNLVDEINIRKKQMIVDYICTRLFYLRRLNKIPPFLLIMEEAHQFCLSEDTEILTSEGWKKYSNIEVGDYAFSYNCETEKLELNPIERIIIRDHSGDMIKLFNEKSIDALITKDHRVLCNCRTTGKNRKWHWSENKFVLAKNLPGGIRIPLAAEIISKTECEIDNDLIKILGWIITDGNKHFFEDKKCFSYEISQSKAKSKILNEMTNTIKRRFPDVSIYKRKREDRIIRRTEENIFYFKKDASQEINDWLLNEPHRIPRKFLGNASITQLKILFDAMVQGDGNIQNSDNGFKYVTYFAGKNEGLADDFHELCVRLGLSAIKKYVQQNKQIKLSVSFKRKSAHIRKATSEYYSGKVWDITIKNGAFVVRRKGTVFFTGNCPEAAEAKAISKSIIETISREGRKFMACLCLISQRPKKLSSTALSQLNSKMVLNIKNPYDLKHLMDSSEAITKEYADMISSLGVGEMLLMGNAVNYPIFIEVRERIYKPQVENIPLDKTCLNWHDEQLT